MAADAAFLVAMLLGNRVGRRRSLDAVRFRDACGGSFAKRRQNDFVLPLRRRLAGDSALVRNGWAPARPASKRLAVLCLPAVRVAPPPPIAPQRGKLTLSVSSGLAHGPLLAARPVRAIRLARGACRLAGQDRRGDSDLVVAMRAADDLREASAGWLPPAPFQGARFAHSTAIDDVPMVPRALALRASDARCGTAGSRRASSIRRHTLTMAAAVHIPMVETQGIATSGSLDPVSAQRAGAGG